MTTNNCEISQKTYHLIYKMGALKPSEKKTHIPEMNIFKKKHKNPNHI